LIKSIFILLTMAITIGGQTLPIGLTDAEKKQLSEYQSPSWQKAIFTAPDYIPRTMAEWEELEGLLITWTAFPEILAQIVDHAQEETVLYIICSDSNAVKSYLNSRRIGLHNIVFLEESYNSIWARDYGPWTVYKNDVEDASIVDWEYNRPRPFDDNIPGHIADVLEIPIYQTTQNPERLVHTGGNFMVDGLGTGFSSALIEEENPGLTVAQIDTIMKNFMGIERFIRMPVLPYDGIHHIDMHMKLLDPETILVGEYPDGVADGPQIEANIEYIRNNYLSAFGTPYRFVRIPMPPDAGGSFPDNWGDYRTYTNSVIVNSTVLVPVYEEQYDTTALRIYRENMPGYNVIGIDCNDIIPLGGAIHCITKEIGSRDPIRIVHNALANQEATSQFYPVEALVQAATALDTVWLNYRVDSEAGFSRLVMTNTGCGQFYGEIPAGTPGDVFEYFIAARNTAGKTMFHPRPAPAGRHFFQVKTTTEVADRNSIIGNTFTLDRAYPNPFNGIVTFQFTMQTSAPVTITIFDAAGHKIRDLHSGTMPGGQHRMRWNGMDNNGIAVSSGLYFVRFANAGNQYFQKVSLLK
jgi:agmatine deiminase